MPKTVGKYEFVADINKGSYGQVSLVRDMKSDKLYALKYIAQSSYALDEDFAPSDSQKSLELEKDKLYQEAVHEINIHRVLGSHPNIVQLHDHFQQNDKQYLILEYCAPGDLYEAIKAGRGPREQGNVLEFMLQLIDAVAFSHSKGVYHRDIKPENILIAADGTVKLADWGLASTKKICKDFGVGSERYMAPELFDERNTTEYDAEKADIWSIGICLLNILFGRNPFTVATQKDKLFLDFASSREALFDIFPSLSADVFAVLRHSLTLDPDNRSLSSMREQLVKVQMWTTDDEYFYDEDVEDDDTLATGIVSMDEQEYDHCLSSRHGSTSSASNDESGIFSNPVSTAPITPIVATPAAINSKREPFRTPSHFQLSKSPAPDGWQRTMQFTPPTQGHGFRDFHVGTSYSASAAKRPSHLSVIHSSADNDNEDRTDLLDIEENDDAEHSIPEEFDSDGAIDDVFAMDGELSDTFQRKMSIGQRNVSNSNSSVSSVPSLVQSLPRSNVSSMLAAPKPKDFLKLGKSWSDIDFDDDNDDEFFEYLRAMPPMSAPRGGSEIQRKKMLPNGPLVIPWTGHAV